MPAKTCISKGIQPIFEIFASARRCWGWPFGWKVSASQVFYFCNGKLKTLRIDIIWNFPLPTCSLSQQKSCISKGIQTIFENFASARRCWRWAFGSNVSVAQIFYFCNGKVKTLRIDNIWNFATFNKNSVPAKILYLQRYSTDFRKLCFSSKMLRVGFWVESFSCAGILLLQWHGENFAHRQHLKFCHFQPFHCHSKNPISPKVFNRFSKSLPEHDDVEGGHLGGKFQLRRYFTFAMAWWKHCASTTFEILPLSTCSLSQQKSYISKGIQPIFEFFSSARRCWGWAFWWKVSCAQVVYCCNVKAKTLRIENIWNFAIFNLYTVPAKTYISKGIQPIFEIFASARRCWGWAFGWKVSCCAGILVLQWRGENFAHRQHLKFCNFQPVQCASKNPISPKVFNRFSKSLPQLDDVEGGYLSGKFQVSRNFTFAMARWKHCASTTFEILALSTCTLCQQKSYISKGIQPIFEIFASARRSLRGGIWVECFRCAGVLLLQRQAENFAHRHHLKFCHVQPVHCHSKNPVSPKVFNRFSKALLQLEDVLKSFMCAGSTLCNGKAKTLRIDNIWNFGTFNLFTVHSKNPISPKVFNRFPKSLPEHDDVEGGHLGGKFQLRRYFTLAMARWKHCASTTFEILPLSTCTVCQQKSYISKGIQPIFENLCLSSTMLKVGIWVESFRCAGILLLQRRGENFAHRQHLKFWHFLLVQSGRKNAISPKVFSRFSKSLPQREDLERRHLGGMFQVRRCFTFATASWKLCALTSFEISHFQPVHCHSKNPVSPKVFKRFSKILLQLEDVEGGHLSGKFQVRRYFTFAMARRKLCASTTFEILPLSTCTVCQQKSYISKGIQPIFEIFASARRCWRWAFEWKVSGEQVFCFCNGEVKTLRIDNIWNFGTFNLYRVPKRSYISKVIQPIFEIFASARRSWDGGIWVECFRFAGVLLLQRQAENFAHRHHLKFCQLSTCTLSQQKSCISKGIQPIFENFASARRCWRWAFEWKVSGAQVFYFAMARRKLCASTTFEILPLSTCSLSQQKSHISKGIQPISEIFAWARRCWGWAFGWKVSAAQVFYFCNGKVKTLRIDYIWNFATFNLYSVPAKILYLQRYSTDFRILCLS